MKVDIIALKHRITDCGMSQQDVAKKISVDKSTFSRKMQNNAATFTIGEMHKIVEVLGLTKDEAKRIFLA